MGINELLTGTYYTFKPYLASYHIKTINLLGIKSFSVAECLTRIICYVAKGS